MTQDSQFLYVFGGQQTTIERYHIGTGFTGWEEIQCNLPPTLSNHDGYALIPAWQFTPSDANIYILGGLSSTDISSGNQDILTFNTDTLLLQNTNMKTEVMDHFESPCHIDPRSRKVILLGRKHVHVVDITDFNNLQIYQKKGK